jgi:hypothetical protein
MKTKTNELTGPALDWAVAVADNLLPKHISFDFTLTHPLVLDGIQSYGPSFIWSQGGPIIERERITLVAMPDGTWQSKGRNLRPHFHNPTPLIAAMRCYVSSKLGDEIDVPEELRS